MVIRSVRIGLRKGGRFPCARRTEFTADDGCQILSKHSAVTARAQVCTLSLGPGVVVGESADDSGA